MQSAKRCATASVADPETQPLIVGVLAGGLFATGLLIRKGLKARNEAFAYGPFLAFGALVVLFVGGH